MIGGRGHGSYVVGLGSGLGCAVYGGFELGWGAWYAGDYWLCDGGERATVLKAEGWWEVAFFF